MKIACALSLAAAAAGCSQSGGGTLGVQLVYPAPPAASAGPSQAPPRAPNYATHPSDRILVRVLGPHFAPIERWFDRSAGRGEISGVPAGTRITVEVDEYDNTAATLGTKAPLLGRGWHNGIALSPGEVKTVPVAMYAKGTIVTICGAPPSGGSGTPGDTGDGGLDNEALLGNPVSVKAGPDDSIYVSSSAFGKVRRIDRYGYISTFAGNGSHGTIAAGTPASASPIGAVSDIDIDPSGSIYLFNYWSQIVKVTNSVIDNVVYDNGVENPIARPDIAIDNLGFVSFVNYIDSRVFRLVGTVLTDFVRDDIPYDITEPISRFNYPLRSPSSITFVSAGESLVIADTDNNRIMRISLLDGNIYYLVANAGGIPFAEGIDPLGMAPVKPRVVDYNPITGKIFFVEQGTNRVLHIDSLGKVRTFAGTGVIGFSGDGGPATEAQLNDPRAVTVDSRGNAYLADFGNHAVRMVVGGALP
ncbi:MAG TPA: hypothetical protein VF847_02630 [Candidatus Deferrimicrobiaceae bacterium]